MKITEIVHEHSRLDEILKNPVEFSSNTHAIDYFNNLYGSRIFKGHTNVMGTPEMFANGTMVVRIMDSEGYIQYHIHSKDKIAGERNRGKAVNKHIDIAAINIIYHDAKSYLNRSKRIKILAPTAELYELYKKMAERLLKEIPNNHMVVTDSEPTADADGTLQQTFIIHEPLAEKMCNGLNVPLMSYQ